MRLLADENFPRVIVDFLRDTGHDVVWARYECPQWADLELLNRAETEGRIVLTLDKDFWQIALQRRSPLKKSGVILFRTHPATVERIEPLVRAVVEANVDWTAHISIVTADGIQMKPTARG